ncbi:putative sulfate exporter family transporter [Galbibacter sp. BG1]|uniref:YeiH family protein n=1 Tax=Galbibacter sp. BG1 TaxID=1170699 RepID=UPI0015C1A033|nr:putative sulfate exporter family transporter [Galbibacter sp. BG1]QLE02955.1 putative sulfate exporter family transporter [Galbibacter sp. BG1]
MMLSETTSNKSNKITKWIWMGVAICCTAFLVSPPVALGVGIVLAQFIENPFPVLNHKAIQWLLKIAVVGLGFGMTVNSAISAGKEGFWFTAGSIFTTLLLGLILGKVLGIDKIIAQLISSGTAICGGSAIAAIAPIVKANTKQISISIGVVFLLNSLALFLFPPIGHLLHMTQHQFGLWSAIAIHDTSSVVGAADAYGNEALAMATTVKLARALWILPVSLVFAFLSHGSIKKIKIPYFIGLFILAIILNTYVPQVSSITPWIVSGSKIALSLVLFVIGSTLDFSSLKSVGTRPLFLAVGIWVFISVLSLIVILHTGA